MKTKEFIRRVIDLNPCWQVHGNDYSITVLNEEKCKAAVVSLTEEGLCKMWLSRVPEPFPYLLANLVRDFALTPLSEREDEKRYYVKVFNGDLGYLSIKSSTNVVTTNDINGNWYQTQFTKSEIKKLEQLNGIAIDWDKVKLIEVDDDED